MDACFVFLVNSVGTVRPIDNVTIKHSHSRQTNPFLRSAEELRHWYPGCAEQIPNDAEPLVIQSTCFVQSHDSVSSRSVSGPTEMVWTKANQLSPFVNTMMNCVELTKMLTEHFCRECWSAFVHQAVLST